MTTLILYCFLSFLCQSSHPILVTDFIKQRLDGFRFSDYFRTAPKVPVPVPIPVPILVPVQPTKTQLQTEASKGKKLFEGWFYLLCYKSFN